MADEQECCCNYHLGMGPNLKCPVHGEANIAEALRRNRAEQNQTIIHSYNPSCENSILKDGIPMTQDEIIEQLHYGDCLLEAAAKTVNGMESKDEGLFRRGFNGLKVLLNL